MARRNPKITTGHTEQGHSPTATQTTQALALVPTKAEPRVDSRLLAQHLGGDHDNVIALVTNYRPDFEQLGVVLFQTEKPTPGSKGGRPERFALLNEDQAYLLLTYRRNTAKVRALKVQLVKAFAQARRAAAVRQTEYLPNYHVMQERIHTLAQGSPNERFLHMNVAKLVNKVAGIEAGQRPNAPLPKQSVLAVAHMMAAQAVQRATDRHQIQGLVKAALAPLAQLTTMHALEAAS